MVGHGLIVKNPRFVMNPRTPLRVRVPTIKLDDGWVVQPKVVKKDRKKAVQALRKSLIGVSCDLHSLNVGWMKQTSGKRSKWVPKMFDW